MSKTNDNNNHDLIPAELERTFAEHKLAPVPQRWRETLRIWLAHNGNTDSAAAELGVHANSVRYRLRKIADALGQDLHDPQTRMELWFALRA